MLTLSWLDYHNKRCRTFIFMYKIWHWWTRGYDSFIIILKELTSVSKAFCMVHVSAESTVFICQYFMAFTTLLYLVPVSIFYALNFPTFCLYDQRHHVVHYIWVMYTNKINFVSPCILMLNTALESGYVPEGFPKTYSSVVYKNSRAEYNIFFYLLIIQYRTKFQQEILYYYYFSKVSHIKPQQTSP